MNEVAWIISSVLIVLYGIFGYSSAEGSNSGHAPSYPEERGLEDEEYRNEFHRTVGYHNHRYRTARIFLFYCSWWHCIFFIVNEIGISQSDSNKLVIWRWIYVSILSLCLLYIIYGRIFLVPQNKFWHIIRFERKENNRGELYRYRIEVEFKYRRSNIDEQTWVYEKDSGDNSCSICLNDFKSGEKLVTPSCNHNFHYKCLDKWLDHRENCPVCRSDIV